MDARSLLLEEFAAQSGFNRASFTLTQLFYRGAHYVLARSVRIVKY